MSAFMKRFQPRKNVGNEKDIKRCCSWESLQGLDGIRILVFKDHDLKGRDLVFDSGFTMCRPPAAPPVPPKPKTAAKPAPTSSSSNQPPQPAPRNKASHGRSSSDVKLIGEMMFGALPMCSKTTTFKVHLLRDPSRLMITKVFVPSHDAVSSQLAEAAANSCSYSASLDASCSSAPVSLEHQSYDLYKIQSLNQDDIVPPSPRSMPPLAPHSMAMDISSSLKTSSTSTGLASSVPTNLTDDAGLLDSVEDYGLSESGGLSLTSSLNLSSSSMALDSLALSSGPSSLNLLSYCTTRPGSQQSRRLGKHQATQLEGNQVLLQLMGENNRASLPPLHKRPTKIGLGVIFLLSDIESAETKRFESFIFSHMSLIENYMNRLKLSIDVAVQSSNSAQVFIEAMQSFLHSIRSLYSSNRLDSPVWLSLISQGSLQYRVGQKFLSDFMFLIDKCDTKSTKFFLSSTITAVLTHHLSWVSTVIPAGDSPSKSYLNKHMPSWLCALAKSHPYNPLWAQLGDLCGAIGFPLCFSRTVVIGAKAELVSRLLNVLSYFIRCSDIIESNELVIDIDNYRPAPVPTPTPVSAPSNQKSTVNISSADDQPTRTGDKTSSLSRGVVLSKPQEEEINIVDAVMKQISDAVLARDGTKLISRDEGNRVLGGEDAVEAGTEALLDEESGKTTPDNRLSDNRVSFEKNLESEFVCVDRHQIIQDSRVEHEIRVRRAADATLSAMKSGQTIIDTFKQKFLPNSIGSKNSQKPMITPKPMMDARQNLVSNDLSVGAWNTPNSRMRNDSSASTRTSGSGSSLYGAIREDLSQVVGNIEALLDDSIFESAPPQPCPVDTKQFNKDVSVHRLPSYRQLYPNLGRVFGDMSYLLPHEVSSFLSPHGSRCIVDVPYVRRTPCEKSEKPANVSINSNPNSPVHSKTDNESNCETNLSASSECRDSLEKKSNDLISLERTSCGDISNSSNLDLKSDKQLLTDSNVTSASINPVLRKPLRTMAVSRESSSKMLAEEIRSSIDRDSGVESLDRFNLDAKLNELRSSNNSELNNFATPAPRIRPPLVRGMSKFDDLYDDPTLDVGTLINEKSDLLDLGLTDTNSMISDTSEYASGVGSLRNKNSLATGSEFSDWPSREYLDVEDDSGVSAEHFSSISVEIMKAEEGNLMSAGLVTDPERQIQRQICLLKDAMSQQRRRHSSGQSQTSLSRCRSTSPVEQCGGMAGLCRCTSVASSTTDCMDSSFTPAVNNFIKLPLVVREPVSRDDVAAVSRSSVPLVTATASTAAAASAAATAAVSEESSSATAATAKPAAAKISHEYNFGRSLLVGVCDHYMSDFILHGTKDRSVLEPPYTRIHADLKASVQNSIIDEPIAEASCITADLDKWCVQLFSCKYNTPDTLPTPHTLSSSQLICNLVESVHDFCKLKVSPEFCLVHLEDCLQQIFLKSKILAEYIRVHRKLYSKELATLHGFDMSDMPLLLAVAVTHSPHIVISLMDALPSDHPAL